MVQVSMCAKIYVIYICVSKKNSSLSLSLHVCSPLNALFGCHIGFIYVFASTFLNCISVWKISVVLLNHDVAS